MSIVALKRNSQRYINKISHDQGKNGFALNGGLRNVGWVGQTSLARIGSSHSFCVYQNPSVVKLSTKNTSGLLSSSIRYPVSAGCTNGGCDPLHSSIALSKKTTTNGPIMGPLSGGSYYNQSSAYTQQKVSSVAYCNIKNNNCPNPDGNTDRITIVNNPTEFKPKINCPPSGCKAASYHIGGRLVYYTQYNKDPSSFSAMTAGDYLRRRAGANRGEGAFIAS